MNEANNKWLVVVNPKAGAGKSIKDWPDIKQLLEKEGFDFDHVLTEYQGHAIEIARQAVAEQGYRKLIAVGGDGTNNEVLNGIFTQDAVPCNQITMATIPIGTGNDWTRTFEFPSDYKKIVKIIKSGYAFPHDVGKVTYYNDGDPKARYFLNAAGTGLDEMVCGVTNEMKRNGKSGPIRYLLSVVKCLFSYKCTHVKVEIDDKEVFDDYVLSLSVGNCCYIGGGMMMMPKAIPDDGELDVTIIKQVSLFKFAANVKSIYNGTFVNKMKEVSTFRGKRIHIVSIPEHSLKVETEGEELNNSPFDFEILPKAINVVVKQNAGRKAHKHNEKN